MLSWGMDLLAVPGQERAGQILATAWKAGMLSHAYIFLGSPGAGGRELALALAQALACSQPTETGGCGVCKQCHLILSGNHPDYTELGLLPRKKNILLRQIIGGKHETVKSETVDEGEDELEEDTDDEGGSKHEKGLIDWISLSPYSSHYKVAVILHGDRIRTEAANALLKTIEEPPDKSILILLVENLAGVLPTIISRCQIVRLAPPPMDTLITAFCGGGLGELPARAMAWRGKLYDDVPTAFKMVDDARGAARALLAVLGKGEKSVSEALEIVGREKLEREMLRVIVEEMGLWLRDLCWLAGGGSTDELANSDLQRELKADGAKYKERDLVEAWQLISAALRSIDANANLKLVLDELVIKLAKC
jgi:DNA polymerase-3 subunit delta'